MEPRHVSGVRKNARHGAAAAGRQVLNFDTQLLMPFDIFGVRTQTHTGAMIRAILNSYTSHTAPITPSGCGGWVVADTTPPASAYVPLSQYEDQIARGDIVRVWRIVDASYEERLCLCAAWSDHVFGRKYNQVSVYRLWVMRVVNGLPYRIYGNWCTRALGTCFAVVFSPDRNPFRKPDGRIKKNETPRTPENRIVAGILRDVTDLVLKPA